MAEALVGVLIERLTSVALNKVNQELKLVLGVDKEIESLTRTLEAIQAVLEDAEQRQVQEASVRLWLSNLKEVADKIWDVLDEWSYEILKRQVVEKQRDEETGGCAHFIKNKVCFPILSPCCCSSGVNQVARHYDIAKKIKDLSEMLVLIDSERQAYHFQLIERSPEQQLIKHQKTSSLLDISFGRDHEKENLISKLLDEGGEEESVPLIIPIVGMGGVGKTNLSQLVHNDENVKALFNKRIWICVSEPFEEVQIIMAIAQGLGIKDHPMSNLLEMYSQYIVESLEGKEKGKKIKEKTKFLIVLDDVWNPTEYQWEQVIKPLRAGAKGSKIVVTTRIEKVAVTMGVVNNVIHLGMLREEYCRRLFFHFASIGREIKDPRMFEVGNEIVRKCKGLPLAAKTLGSLVRGKRTLEDWEGVLNSRVWKLKEFEQSVFQPLLLSYYDLQPSIRRCLLYCAIFPKDHQIIKSELIRLWMSQDYLFVKEEIENIFMVGEAYFDDLVMRSFFQDFLRDGRGNIISCKMHDIVHDFVQYLTKNEFLILDSGISTHPEYKVRHLAITIDRNQELSFGSANLFTVILDVRRSELSLLSLLQLKSLRTLHMNKFQGVIPNEIGKLIHLRYFQLTENNSFSLPETLCDLYNLQTLIIVNCVSIRRLPHGMRKLINLKHVDVRGCSFGVSRLLSLGVRTLLHGDPIV